MSPITSFYIPCVENFITADFIANVFYKNGIAKVSKILFEPIKKHLSKNKKNIISKKYKRAFILVHYWLDTENAYNFIQRLINNSLETRFQYGDDQWWPIYNNLDITKFSTNTRILTIYSHEHFHLDNDLDNDPLDNDPLEQTILIDVPKTKLLFNIVQHFKNKHHDTLHDTIDFENYINDIDFLRYSWL